MALKRKKQEQEVQVVDEPVNPFREELPITGGNAYTVKELLTTRDDVIKSWTNLDTQRVASNLNKALGIDSTNNTYHYWYLLNFIADYFSNIVQFQFDKSDVQKAVMIAIRVGIIYGRSAVWKVNDKIGGMYINKLDIDVLGYPEKLDMTSGIDVLMSQETNPDFSDNKKNIIKTIDDNIKVFLPYNHRVGGLVMWRPFLLTLEKLLKMVYTNSYQYLRSFTYRINDPSAMLDELKLFTNINNPFLITLGNDDNLITNKFGTLDLGEGKGLELMEFIKEFQNIFYELIGRKTNADKKNERNTAGEVESTQHSFSVLQNELIANIKFLLEDVKTMTGCNYQILNESELIGGDQDDTERVSDAERESDNN